MVSEALVLELTDSSELLYVPGIESGCSDRIFSSPNWFDIF